MSKDISSGQHCQTVIPGRRVTRGIIFFNNHYLLNYKIIGESVSQVLEVYWSAGTRILFGRGWSSCERTPLHKGPKTLWQSCVFLFWDDSPAGLWRGNWEFPPSLSGAGNLCYAESKFIYCQTGQFKIFVLGSYCVPARHWSRSNDKLWHGRVTDR